MTSSKMRLGPQKIDKMWNWDLDSLLNIRICVRTKPFVKQVIVKGVCGLKQNERNEEQEGVWNDWGFRSRIGVISGSQMPIFLLQSQL